MGYRKISKRNGLEGFFRGLIFFIILLGFCRASYSLGINELISPIQKKVQPAQSKSGKQKIIDIIPYSARLVREFYDLQNKVGMEFDLVSVREKLEKVARDIDDLSIDIAFLEGTPHQNYNRLLYFNVELEEIDKSLGKIDKSLSLYRHTLMEARENWLNEKEKIPMLEAQVKRLGSPEVERKALSNLKKTIHNALRLIDKKLKPILDVEEKLSTLRTRNHALVLEVQDWVRNYKGEILEKNTPSLISPVFFKQLNGMLWKSAWKSLEEFTDQQSRHILKNIWLIIAIVIVTVILTILIYHSRRYVDMTSSWFIFTRHPLAAALFICLTFFAVAIRPLPPGWYPAFQFGVVVTVMHLMKGLFVEKWKLRVVNHLAILILITSLIRMIIFPRSLLRVIVACIAIAGIFFCVWESCHKKETPGSPLIIFSLRLGTLILVATLIAEFIGYSGFSLYLLNSFLMTVFAILNILMLYLMVSGFSELILYKLPFPFIRKNAAVILGRLKPILAFLFSGFFFLSTLVIWKVATTRNEALQWLFSLGFETGSLNITLGVIFSAAVVLYGAFIVSWAIQNLLLQEVLPRRKMELGSQLSIARLVHYGIVFIGFLVMLKVLGFGLTNLTIIGGALGVGVGFGLQAIVNNFASGLILLFERPIKVGDAIQIDNDMAIVKRLGLRSTIVQTLDNAEIVVPNSELVTSKVTNWTLANRRIRVKVPVGVAYGSDIEKVRKLLLECAGENPKILKYPEPLALFLAFGDSSLNFELRVWIDEFMEGTGEVQSELNNAINEKFNAAGIEIPFPQTDLHLRSVDEEAAKSLLGEEEAGTSEPLPEPEAP